MRKSGLDDDKGMVSDIEGICCLGGRKMLHSMRDGISVWVAVVLVALIVVVRVMVLMVVVEVVVLVIVVGVLCVGAMEVVGVLYRGVVKVDFAEEVVDILVLGGVFVVEVVEEVELVVGCVVSIVLWCANGTGDFL